MWDLSISIVCVSDEIYPRDIFLVVELVQMFDKQRSILTSQIYYAKTPPPPLLGLVHFFHATTGLLLALASYFLHMHCLLALSTYL
jgi:hypothetical protein